MSDQVAETVEAEDTGPWLFDEETGYFRERVGTYPVWLYCPTCDIAWTEDRPDCPICGEKNE